MRFIVFLSILFASTAASATADNTVRHPSSSSIPCLGSLTEWAIEGGNVHNSFQALQLMCESQGKIVWMLNAGVSCGELDDERDANDVCTGARMDAFYRFAKGGDDHVHSYHLTRYVFAKECVRIKAKLKRTQAVTGKEFGSNVVDQVVCGTLTLVDGTKADDGFSTLTPGRFRYATVTTTGVQSTSGDEIGPEIVNAPVGAGAYRLRFQDGKQVEE